MELFNCVNNNTLNRYIKLCLCSFLGENDSVVLVLSMPFYINGPTYEKHIYLFFYHCLDFVLALYYTTAVFILFDLIIIIDDDDVGLHCQQP